MKARAFNKSKGRDGIELPEEGDILVWYEGHKYPIKGYAFAPLVEATAIIKRTILEGLRFLSEKPQRYCLFLFFLLPKAMKKKIVYSGIKALVGIADRVAYTTGMEMDSYHRSEEENVKVGFKDSATGQFYRVIQMPWEIFDGNYFLKLNRYCRSGQEIYRVGMILVGIDILWQNVVRHICMAWQFETAYRFRGQDLFGEIDIAAFKKDPVKEIIRLIDILIARENYLKGEKGVIEDMEDKWLKMRGLISIFLKFNKWIFEPILKIIDEIDFEKLKLDTGDLYHALPRDYNIKGLDYEERIKLREKIDGTDKTITAEMEKAI